MVARFPWKTARLQVLDAAGNVAGVVLVFHDVTAKRRAAEALRASEARFRALVQNSSERKKAEEERSANLHFFESLDRVNRAIQGTDDPEQMMSAP
jgi:PAS domain-containing protein